MGSILAYAGVRAKLAGMANRFLKKSDYEILMSKKSVPEITTYLQQTKMYSKALKNINPEELHRRYLEMLLKADLVEDVRRFFTFFVTLDKAFASYVIRMYEIENLKLALRNTLVEKESKKNLEELKSKFYDLGKRALVDPMKVASAVGKDEILNSLESTPYYEVVRNVFVSYKGETPNLIGSVENGLDRWLFFGFLNAAKDLGYDDYMIVKEMIGERIDLINIEWIIRAKSFYSLRAEELYNSLIPMEFRMNVSLLHKLCDAKHFEEDLELLIGSSYKNLFSDISESSENVTPEMVTLAMRKYLYGKTKRALSTLGGFSIASFFHYLFLKEYEIMDITTIIEGVRYNIEAKEIEKYLTASF